MAETHPIPEDARFQDLTGHTFFRWTVESFGGKRGKHLYWNCRCDCGTRRTVIGFSLKDGNSRSCGCLQIETATKHGMSQGQERFLYDVWRQMIERCHNQENSAFENYGGRGIIVCERWRLSVLDFIADVGEPPTRKHSLDRIENSGNYEPSNCRWATRKEQNRNTRSNRLITFNGETLCLAEWAERLGLTVMALWMRIEYHGWSIEDALTTPKSKRYTNR